MAGPTKRTKKPSDPESQDEQSDEDDSGSYHGQQETPCVQQFFTLVEELSKQHASSEVQNEIQKILKSNDKIGFLINERFVNIPAKISISMLTSLSEELQKMKKKSPSYDFQYFFLISKICKPKNETDTDIIYSNDEEVIFVNESEVNFEFNVAKETDTGLGGRWASEDKEVIPFRKVMLFKADKLNTIIQKITNFVQ